MIQFFSGVASKLARYAADIIGTKAGVSFGVPAGQKIYLDVDQATPNDSLSFDTDRINVRAGGTIVVAFRPTLFEPALTTSPGFDDALDLGRTIRRWRDLYISRDIHIDAGGKLNLEGFTGDTYLTRSGAGVVDLFIDAVQQLRITTTALVVSNLLIPNFDASTNLGTQGNRWFDIFASRELRIDDGAFPNMLAGFRWAADGDAYMQIPTMTTALKLGMSGAWGPPEAGRVVYDTNLGGQSTWTGLAWINPPQN